MVSYLFQLSSAQRVPIRIGERLVVSISPIKAVLPDSAKFGHFGHF